MKKLKDIFYDKNDILVALIIVAVAALVISNRIDSILAYPTSLEAQTTIAANEKGKQPEPPVQYTGQDDPAGEGNEEGNNGGSEGETDANPPAQGGASTKDPEQGQDNNPPSTENPAKPTNHKIEVAPGSTVTKIADSLVSAGLIKDRQAFLNAVTAANADTKLKAGTFTVPSDSTPEQIVSILTK